MKHTIWMNVMVIVTLLAMVFSRISQISFAETFAPAIWYVDVNATGDDTGESWEHAFNDLQAALVAALPEDEIWVSAGIYTPTSSSDRGISFELKAGVGLYGGFAGTEISREERDWTLNSTILSGDIDINDSADPYGVITDTASITGTNSYHVVYSSGVTETAVLDGFTITGGNADGVNTPSYYGGGMYNDSSSSPSLTNLIFQGNSANYGGGMFNDGSPMLTNITFQDNSADYYGGGLHSEGDSPLLTNLIFQDNSAGYNGGGMANGGSSPTLADVTFFGNIATAGGGMSNLYSTSPTLTNVTFFGNTATAGGGMWNYYSSPILTNVTFQGNSADHGGGMSNDFSSYPKLSNSILWNNNAAIAGSQIYNDSSNPTIAYSDVQDSGGSASWDANLGSDGGGNIDSTPLFVDADGGDLRLQLSSPAIDAGDNSAVPVEITSDLGGHPRFVDLPSVPDTGNGTPPLVDMGAYEAQIFTLTVSKAGTGSGMVTSDPPGIDCGSDCSEDVFHTTTITLTATADSDSIFNGWSGDCSGEGCTLTMDSEQTVTATFLKAIQEIYLPILVYSAP